MKNPLVSVIVATYRREVSLEKALQSVCRQTYSPIEVIVVDDNDDPVWNEKVIDIVANKKKTSDINIALLQNHPNQGSAKARNIGIDAANGEYITFLDDDDLYLPEKVENQIQKMISDNADYSLTDLDLFYDNEVICERRKRGYLEKEGGNLLKCHLKYHMTGTDTMMFKKNYLLKIGCFEPIDVGDEYYLMMKAIRGRGLFSYLPQSDVKAYVHTGENGLSSGISKIKGENDLYEFKKTFFTELVKKDVRYIKMRHFAVLAFAYLRANKKIRFLYNGFKAVAYSPKQSFLLLKERKL